MRPATVGRMCRSREFDICEMILDLKQRDMLPCLMFHLNSFEAIRLLQALLAGLEYRQKVAFPTYYLDKVAEKNALKKEADAAVKSTGMTYITLFSFLS